jgi:hypothetical protein
MKFDLFQCCFVSFGMNGFKNAFDHGSYFPKYFHKMISKITERSMTLNTNTESDISQL